MVPCRAAPPAVGSLEREQPAIPPFDPDAPEPGAAHRRDAHLRVRLGLSDVTGIDVPKDN